MFEAQREPTLEEIEWGPEGKPSAELLEARACMAAINERERLKEVAQSKEALPYSDALAQEICEKSSCGALLINVCLDEHLPSYAGAINGFATIQNSIYCTSLL
jgi:hypothetical protein